MTLQTAFDYREEQSQDPFKDALSKFKSTFLCWAGLTGAKSIGQRSKSVTEVQGPFDTFVITTGKRLDAALKKATETRHLTPHG